MGNCLISCRGFQQGQEIASETLEAKMESVIESFLFRPQKIGPCTDDQSQLLLLEVCEKYCVKCAARKGESLLLKAIAIP